MVQRLRIAAPHPAPRAIKMVVQALERGALVAYPTDSLFALGCDPLNKQAVLRLCQVKGLEPKQANLSYLCSDLSQASQLFQQIDRDTYRLIHRNTPGPFTFILEASREVPHHFGNKKKQIGIRIPDHYFVQALLEAWSRPILSTTLLSESDESEQLGEDLVQPFEHLIDVWVDDERYSGYPSAMIDCTTDPPEILREGPVALR